MTQGRHPVLHTLIGVWLLLLAAAPSHALAQDATLPPPDDLKTWRRMTHDAATTTSTCIGRIDDLSCAVDTEAACLFRADEALCAKVYRAGTFLHFYGEAPPKARWIYKLGSSLRYTGTNFPRAMVALTEGKAGIPVREVHPNIPQAGDVLIAVERRNCFEEPEDECMGEAWRENSWLPPVVLVFRALPGQGWQAVGNRIEPEKSAAVMAAMRAKNSNLPPPDPPGAWRYLWQDLARAPDRCGGKVETIRCALDAWTRCYWWYEVKWCAAMGHRVPAHSSPRSNEVAISRLRGAVEYRGGDIIETIVPLTGYYVSAWDAGYMDVSRLRKGDILIGSDNNRCKASEVEACIAQTQERIDQGAPPAIQALRYVKGKGWRFVDIGGGLRW